MPPGSLTQRSTRRVVAGAIEMGKTAQAREALMIENRLRVRVVAKRLDG